MSTTSTKLGLVKPQTSDAFSTSTLAANWQKVDDHPGVRVCTSASRPSWGSNQAGMLISETDTGTVLRWNGSAWKPLIYGGQVNVMSVLSDPADGATTTEELNTVIVAVSAAGGGELYFPAGEYHVAAIDPLPDEPFFRGGIELYPNVSLYGESGARLIYDDPINGNTSVLLTTTPPWAGDDLPITSDVAVGDTTFTCAGGVGGLVAGDTVTLRLGQLDYDHPEAMWWAFATVVSASGTSVELDRAAAIACDISEMVDIYPDPPGPYLEFPVKSFAMIRKLDPAKWCEHVRIEGLEFVGWDPTDGPQGNVVIRHARTSTFRNVVSTGSSLVVHYNQDVILDNVTVRNVYNQGGSEGTCFSFSGCHVVRGRSCHAESFDRHAINVEAACADVVFDGFSVDNNSPTYDPDYSIFITALNSHLRINGLTVSGTAADGVLYGPNYTDCPPNTTSLSVTDFDLVTAEPMRIIPWNIIRGGVTRLRTTLDGNYVEKFYGPPRVWSFQFPLRASMAAAPLPLPNGIIARMQVFASNVTKITTLNYMNSGMAGVDIKGALEAGKLADITGIRYPDSPAVDVGGEFGYQNYDTGHALVVTTAADMPGGSYAVVRIEHCPILNDGSPANTVTEGMTQFNYLARVADFHQIDPSGRLGFYGTDPIAKQTGVPVTAAGVHAALVALGLIGA